MIQRFAVISGASHEIAPEDEQNPQDGAATDDVFALVEQTVVTIRGLRQENEHIKRREETLRAAIEQERAQWRDEMSRLKDVAEACIERARTAERDTEDARAQSQTALTLCGEAQEREQHANARAAEAEKHAEDTEKLLVRISRALRPELSRPQQISLATDKRQG